MPIPDTDRCETCRFWTPVTKGYADGKEQDRKGGEIELAYYEEFAHKLAFLDEAT